MQPMVHQELLNGKLPKSIVTKREDNGYNSDNHGRSTSSPSPTPLSGIDNNSSNPSNLHLDASLINEAPIPPLLVTPPSPPKFHNMCYSPIAKRYPPPKLVQNTSTGSLLNAMNNVPPMMMNDTTMLHINTSCHSLYSQSSIPSKSCSATPC